MKVGGREEAKEGSEGCECIIKGSGRRRKEEKFRIKKK